VIQVFNSTADHPAGFILEFDEAGKAALKLTLLVTDSAESKNYFSFLEHDETEIESEIGQPLEWHNPSDKRMCRIYVRQPMEPL
jgi:hypothetical protein